ncbi:MAG: rhodanese [Candidatus Diapherotrites archaeon]|uniref:Rhodanese n=1 Tax=Candidatus Iainarchaeum sp. TaxID=3101447 RepID=A0A2D6LQ13_9ARCH|nr:rhodanese [Candidatus Diapherotrites archaeon]|tara:strand:- start:21862 stop:22149 length:288 start_codon:yes stop_codon:yes gene_type:complete
MVKEVSAKEAKKLITAKKAILLDVREKKEIDAGNANPDKCIPLGELAERKNELSTKRPIIVICRSGHRSATATKFLNENGFEAFNLKGGMLAWGS